MAAISNLLVTVIPSDPNNTGELDFGQNFVFLVLHFDLQPLFNRTGVSVRFLVIVLYRWARCENKVLAIEVFWKVFFQKLFPYHKSGSSFERAK